MELLVSRVAETGHSLDDETVMIGLANDDNLGVRLHIPRHLVGDILTSLSAEAGQLEIKLPEDRRNLQSVLPVQDVEVTASDRGDPVVVFRLRTGSEVSFSLDSASLLSLFGQLSLLSVAGSNRPN